jgi:uncharacterized protein YndB with AHSA1/START domain
MSQTQPTPSPVLHPTEADLVLERDIALAPERIWRAWTHADLLEQWFCPAPYRAVDVEIDLRPGGAFVFVIQSPEGERFPYHACILAVVPGHRLIWTTHLLPGFVPAPPSAGVPTFTAVISLDPLPGGGTRYTARAIHKDAASAQQHADMGFHEGWGACLDQLVALMGG